ncbi:MAG: hypothetical protein A3I29_03680 [Candidatus Magasanikbacteria bacterium RIFCSPLOWO2_02_FULL_44_11]|uniref:Uncharacterized protein n=1 Tax=Candidatus Magasanikbacteria bacterium RIFCSPLOWO2_02_FULL_44_11 TaxID=1798689 RepID=A0A1F6NAL3_9BACT|nr:MAG: hypothetical protein A3I29_03680 [Candidatus Magasanikbacteria bacterium RIFCSPLOWO2_02_FULL_44_11]
MATPTIEQVGKFFDELRSARVTRENLQLFLENPDRYNREIGRFGRIYSVTVNRDLWYKGLIKAAKFSQQNNDITAERFPIEGTGIREVAAELYEFDEVVTGEEAAKRIEGDGYQLEDFATLLAFAEAYPKEQLKRPVVQLKSRWRDGGGFIRMPGLYCGRRAERVLDLGWLSFGFVPGNQFLVSR